MEFSTETTTNQWTQCVNRNNDNINLPSNTAAMQDRIKELEQQIANKEQEYDNEKRTQLPKNSRVVPSSGRDNSETNNKTTSNNNAIEIDDILQIISTTMANTKKLRKSLQKTRKYLEDPLGNVINLTKKLFTYHEFKLLNRNLNFIPDPGRYNAKDLEEDKNKFIRNIILRSYFGNDNNYKHDPYHNLKQSNKQWLPKETHHTVHTFIEIFQKEFSALKPRTTNNRDNLTKEERMALKNIKEMKDIIITHADKGGEAERQLKDTNFYTTLDHNPTEKHAEIINETIKTFIKEKLLNEQLGKNLIEHNPKTRNLYFRPKMHKTDTPGRPIVSSIHSHSSRISEFVDIQLEPIVNNIKSHIKDTIDFINKIETIQNIRKDTILVTMDVKSLFTQIPHTEGINAVARTIENAKNTNISNRVILKLLSLTLHLNNFEFNGKHYLQKKGSSMGSKSSCRYADIFMDDFETK